MAPPPFRSFFPLRTFLVFSLLVFVSSLPAAEGGFTATLSPEQQAAAGLTTLSEAQRAALNQVVARQAADAHQDSSYGSGATFVASCTEQERRQAGLDRLTPAQLEKLNELAAPALDSHPKPRERPRIRDSDVLNPATKPEIHGSIAVTYGRGSGGTTFHGSSLWLDYFDPSTGLGLSVGLESFTGRGFPGCYPGYDDFPVAARGILAAPVAGPGRDDFVYGEGQSLRAPGSWDQFGRYRRGL